MRGRGHNIPPVRQGIDGVGIASGSVDASGNLTLTLTSGATISGNLKGPKGDPGAPGSPGSPGAPGANAAPPTFSASLALGATGSSPSASATSADGVAWSIAFVVPKPKDGTNGTNAALPVFTASASGLAAGASPTAAVTGTYPNLAIAIGVPKGDQGLTPSLSVGTVTTLALGATPTVRRRSGDTDAAPILDFGLPGGNLGGSFAVAMLLLAVGVGATYTVSVPGATVDMMALATAPASILPSLSRLSADVTAPDVVTIYLGVSVALAAGTRTFKVRVLR